MRRIVLALSPVVVSAAFLFACNGLIGVKSIYLGDEVDGGEGSNGDGATVVNDATTLADGRVVGGDDDAETDGAASDAPHEGGDAALDAGADADGGMCPGVDASTDPENCGACGHNCLGGACMGGKCQPAQVVTALGQPWAIAVDDTSVYWTDISGSSTGTVYKAARLAVRGAPTQLAVTHDPLTYDLVVDPSGLYFSSGSSDTFGLLESMYPDGGNRRLVNDGGVQRGLSLDSTNAYWIVGADTPTVGTAPKTGGDGGGTTLNTLADSLGEGAFTVVDGSKLYWSTNGAIRRCSLPGCADPGDFVQSIDAYAMTKNSTLFIYSSGDGVFQIAKSAAPGMGAAFAANQPQPVAIVADDKDVYWIDLGTNDVQFNNGSVRHCPIVENVVQCVGDGEVLFMTGNLPRGIAMDGQAVYWTAQGEGAVYRIAR